MVHSITSNSLLTISQSDNGTQYKSNSLLTISQSNNGTQYKLLRVNLNIPYLHFKEKTRTGFEVC
jgi:hypothetical protein